MTSEELRDRTRDFSLMVQNLIRNSPRTEEFLILGKQLLKSSTSIGANYRAACRARSKSEFYAKLCIVVEEADETCYWLELLEKSGLLEMDIGCIKKEADELVKIFATSRKTLKAKIK